MKGKTRSHQPGCIWQAHHQGTGKILASRRGRGVATQQRPLSKAPCPGLVACVNYTESCLFVGYTRSSLSWYSRRL